MPTPIKKAAKKVVGKSTAVPKGVQAGSKKVVGKSTADPRDVQVNSKIPKRKACDTNVNAKAGPSSAVTRIKPSKIQKRARTEPLPEGNIYAGKVVVLTDSE